jgi:hypothetical protein
MRNTNLSKRIKALEHAARGKAPCTFDQHRDLLLEILHRRAVPLPPLDGVDLPATADLWAGDGTREGRSFVMHTGEVVTGEQLAERHGPG